MQSFNCLSPKYRYYFWHSVPNSGLTKFRNGLSTCRQLLFGKSGRRLTDELGQFIALRVYLCLLYARYFYIRSPALIANCLVGAARLYSRTLAPLSCWHIALTRQAPPLPLWHQSRSREQWRDSVPILCTPPRTANFVAYSRVRDLNNARVYNVHTAKWPVAWWYNS